MKVTSIDEQLVRGGQAVYLKIVEEWAGTPESSGTKIIVRRSVLIDIKSDSFIPQCSARVSVWSEEWKTLYFLVPFAMQTPGGLYAGNSQPLTPKEAMDMRKIFEEDVLRLREVGKKILFGKDT